MRNFNFNNAYSLGDLSSLINQDNLIGDYFSGGLSDDSATSGLGNIFNKENLGSIFDTAKGLGQLYGAYQQNKLAKNALNFQKDSFYTNLNNSVQSYNTALEDRIRSRYQFEGRTDKEADQFIEKNKLQGK